MGWTRQEVLDVARSTGRPVVEAWSTHNAGSMGTVLGPMLHHTGSTWSYPANTAPTLRTVREGRSDLQNALCMYYIDYEGVIYCITEKIAWHAGGGSWQGVTDGNGHYAGIEAESDGKQWTKPTVASYKRLAAAILRKTGRTVAYAPRHADYALPRGRKTDFSGMDPATFLADVNADLAGNPTSEEDDMFSDADRAMLGALVWMLVPEGGWAGEKGAVISRIGAMQAVLAQIVGIASQGADVDEKQLAAELAPVIAPLLADVLKSDLNVDGLTAEELSDAVDKGLRKVLGSLDAAQS